MISFDGESDSGWEMEMDEFFTCQSVLGRRESWSKGCVGVFWGVVSERKFCLLC